MKGKRSSRHALSYLAVLPPLAAIALALMMLLAGCGGSSTPVVIDEDPDTGGAMLPVHVFEYDTDNREYKITWGTSGVVSTIARDDVDRDMVGQLCGRCHADKIDEVKDSIHYRLAGRTPRVMYPGGGAHGMLDRACGLPSTTGLTNSISDVNLGECAKCHVNRYLPVMEGMFTNMFTQMGVPNAEAQAQEIVESGIDCLICHAHDYSAHPRDGVIAELAKTASPDGRSPSITGFAREAHDNGDFNHDGFPDLQIDMDGDGVLDAPLMIDTDGNGQPDTPWTTVAQDRSPEAMATIGPTNEHTCLRCHDHARTGYKRGVLFLEGHDVHATLTTGVFEGANNRCTVCHTASHHKFVRGHSVGGDLGASDYPVPAPGTPIDPNDPTDVNCLKCHDAADLPTPIHSARHLATMSCEMCHIPYASGITYSLFGQGGHVAFGRNAEGKDTKVIAADNYVLGDKADQDADWEAHKTRPIYVWFNGGTSFLAQTLSVRGGPEAKITPFKPMANGMVFDSRYFDGVMAKQDDGVDYNAHSMYRFFANGANAEAFFALDMLDMTPTEVRKVTLNDFFNPDPGVQTMAMMQIFPNLVYFDKGRFGYEHYMCGTDSPYDLNEDGIIDVGANLAADMFTAANSGLQQFMGFNGPMGFPADYQWYPPYQSARDTISMKLPDGSLMKMFMQMQAGKVPPEQQQAYLDAVANYPSFSQVTLGGHGVRPKAQALGGTAGNGCMDCHGEGGVLDTPVPVGQKVQVDMGPMGTLEMPLYRWKFYKVSDIVQLGLQAQSEAIVAGTVSTDIDGNDALLRDSNHQFVLNWFMPNHASGYKPADDAAVLAGTTLQASDLTWNGGTWMPVLEPVVDLKPNYEVLGYQKSEIIWSGN